MNNTQTIQEAKSDSEIQKCFLVMKELRPYLEEKSFIEKVKRMNGYGYQLIYIPNDEGVAVAAAGFRITELLHWGKAIYIDDLTTMSSERSKGHASKLLDHIRQIAIENSCGQIHLDSGCNASRYDAHRLYLKKGFNITSHHFALMVNK